MATIVIDPGHYDKYNPGVCPGYYEGNAMLKLAKFLGAELTAKGANVKYTRTTDDQRPSLEQRGAMGAGADLFISLHSDAADSPTVRGVTSFYSVRQPDSKDFAEQIGIAVSDAMGNPFRGAITRPSTTSPGYDYFGVIRSSVAAGAKNSFLIEHGFHTNPQDCAILNSDDGLRRIARAEADAIARHFGLESSGAAPTPPQAGCCMFKYTVQPGEYLFIIAKKFGVSWETIAAANSLMPPYILHPGQTLTIPLCP